MGMFDYVDLKIECPYCGVILEGFQSKDSKCELDIISPKEVNNTYTSCDNCGKWVEYEVVHPKEYELKLIRGYNEGM
jgi:DNA-directed RNA polymerase subunit RPC12/RpoP